MKIEMANLDRRELHVLLGSAIVPLPIALISTVGEDGTYNAAPFSLTFPICWKPPIICVSIGLRRGPKGQKKDTLSNIEFARDFVVNIMDETLIKPAIQTSAEYPSSVDEIREVGLTAIAAEKVKSPRVAEAQVSFECQLVKRFELGEGENLKSIVLGEVVLTHVKDELWVDGGIDPSKLRSVGRLGFGFYCRTRDMIEIPWRMGPPEPQQAVDNAEKT